MPSVTTVLRSQLGLSAAGLGAVDTTAPSSVADVPVGTDTRET